MLYRIVIILCLSKFLYRLQPSHGPIGQFPGFGPADVHVLGADDDHDYFEVVVADGGAEAGACVGGDAGFDAVYASLAEHCVGVVPLISPPIAISVLLDRIKLGTHHFPELFYFHSLS